MKRKKTATIGDWTPGHFETTLVQWLRTTYAQNPTKHLVPSLDAMVKELAGGSSDNDAILESTFRLLIARHAGWRCRQLTKCLARCETPIETKLLLALAIVGSHNLRPLVIESGDGVPFPDWPDESWGITITPQCQIGEFRVDFCVKGFGQKNRGPLTGFSKQMIVECDGHDYHERSAEQARKDKTRDRWFQRMGYLVCRFTGSEITKDPFRCADEALTMLTEAIDREL